MKVKYHSLLFIIMFLFILPFQCSAQSRQNKIDPDDDVLSQLTALRQQLKNEEQKVQSQIGRSTATVIITRLTVICSHN